MTLEELGVLLDELAPGKGVRVPYEIYADFFPPGEPDNDARGRAYSFARSHGVKIDNRPDNKAVWFYKET